jgi:inosine-uridine nucleoside N-ribohydrolase
VGYAIGSGLFVYNDYYVEIETMSPVTRGQTVAHQPAPGGHRANAKVCVEVDGDRLSEMFTRRVASLGRV